jgi:hypothetical protein
LEATLMALTSGACECGGAAQAAAQSTQQSGASGTILSCLSAQRLGKPLDTGVASVVNTRLQVVCHSVHQLCRQPHASHDTPLMFKLMKHVPTEP